jgi:hypothetical protein
MRREFARMDADRLRSGKWPCTSRSTAASPRRTAPPSPPGPRPARASRHLAVASPDGVASFGRGAEGHSAGSLNDRRGHARGWTTRHRSDRPPSDRSTSRRERSQAVHPPAVPPVARWDRGRTRQAEVRGVAAMPGDSMGSLGSAGRGIGAPGPAWSTSVRSRDHQPRASVYRERSWDLESDSHDSVLPHDRHAVRVLGKAITTPSTMRQQGAGPATAVTRPASLSLASRS